MLLRLLESWLGLRGLDGVNERGTDAWHVTCAEISYLGTLGPII